jgi:hypothetical protein
MREDRPGNQSSHSAVNYELFNSSNVGIHSSPSWVDHSCVSLCPSARKLPNRVALEEDQLFRRLFPPATKLNFR